jgi:endonuclease/exonuclease/phosphatase family metal-dependent hydrolase
MWRIRDTAQPGAAHLRVVTYNVHRCRGMDRRTRPERIIDVLASIDPDVVALQEVVGSGGSAPSQAEVIGAALAMGWVMAPVRDFRHHAYGNVVLSRFPIREHAQHELTWKTCEPRGAQRVMIDVPDAGALQVFNVHLGTALLERRYQAQRLASWVHDRRIPGPKLVLGDFNEWARGLAADVLGQRLQSVDLFKHLKRRRTYPGIFPLLHLDHIYFEGRVEVRHVSLPRTRQAMMASDHLPLVADITVRA